MKGYDLKLYPSKIKFVYLGPQTLTNAKATGQELVIGVVYAKSLTINLEQTSKTDVDYKEALKIAEGAIKEALPQVKIALDVLGKIDIAKTSKSSRVLASWVAKDRNLVYGIYTASIKNTNVGLNDYTRAFFGSENLELTLATDGCSPASSPVYEVTFLNLNRNGDGYKVCYIMHKGKPELVLSRDYEKVSSTGQTEPVFVIPRAIGLNGPENIWRGNYFIETQPRKNGKAMQFIYLSINASQKDPLDQRTVVLKRGGGGVLQTALSYPQYTFITK